MPVNELAGSLDAEIAKVNAAEVISQQNETVSQNETDLTRKNVEHTGELKDGHDADNMKLRMKLRAEPEEDESATEKAVGFDIDDMKLRAEPEDDKPAVEKDAGHDIDDMELRAKPEDDESATEKAVGFDIDDMKLRAEPEDDESAVEKDAGYDIDDMKLRAEPEEDEPAVEKDAGYDIDDMELRAEQEESGTAVSKESEAAEEEQPVGSDDAAETEQPAGLEADAESEQPAETEDAVEAEQPEETDNTEITEQSAESGETAGEKQPDETAGPDETVQSVEPEEDAEPGQPTENGDAGESEQLEETDNTEITEQPAESRETAEAERDAVNGETAGEKQPDETAGPDETVQSVEPEEDAESEQPAETGDAVESEQPEENDNTEKPEQPAESGETAEAERDAVDGETAEEKQPDEAAGSDETEQSVESEEDAEPEQPAENEDAVEAEQPEETDNTEITEQPAESDEAAGSGQSAGTDQLSADSETAETDENADETAGDREAGGVSAESKEKIESGAEQPEDTNAGGEGENTAEPAGSDEENEIGADHSEQNENRPDDFEAGDTEYPSDADAVQERAEVSEQLKGALEPFAGETWEQMDAEERKAAIEDLRDSVADELGIQNKPDVVFYSSEDSADFGSYSPTENTIYINETNMGDAEENADTIAHELRHCWQHERAEDPVTEQDHRFKENFEDYIRPEDDYRGYKAQPVESDARSYAERVTRNIPQEQSAKANEIFREEKASGENSSEVRGVTKNTDAVIEKADLPADIVHKAETFESKIKSEETYEPKFEDKIQCILEEYYKKADCTLTEEEKKQLVDQLKDAFDQSDNTGDTLVPENPEDIIRIFYKHGKYNIKYDWKDDDTVPDTRKMKVLKAGQQFDRVGPPSGRCVAEVGEDGSCATREERSIPYHLTQEDITKEPSYHRYEALQDFTRENIEKAINKSDLSLEEKNRMTEAVKKYYDDADMREEYGEGDGLAYGLIAAMFENTTGSTGGGYQYKMPLNMDDLYVIRMIKKIPRKNLKEDRCKDEHK